MRFILAVVIAVVSCGAMAADRMTFTVHRPADVSELMYREMTDGNQPRIYASGELDQDAADRLKEFARVNDIGWAAVYFDSPGGLLLGGVRLGQVIRDLQFDTRIGSIIKGKEAVCASACAYAFAGGLYRHYYGNRERLGLHQFFKDGGNRGDIGTVQSISGLLVAYLQKMGVDALAFSVASNVSSDKMMWLSVDEAKQLQFANNGVLPTTAEIKLIQMQPYLRLEQVSDRVTSRMLLNCRERKVSIMFGIVTNAEVSASKRDSAVRNYLEFDAKEVSPMSSSNGISVTDQTIWIQRLLSSDDVKNMLRAKSAGAWLEFGGVMRWGAFLDMTSVSRKIQDFVIGCTNR